MGLEVNVNLNMMLTMKKKPFLANPKNKQAFINLLGSVMEKTGIQVQHSQGDADYDIAMSACNIALTKPVVVVGDDTDLLILLQHHFSPTVHETIFLQTSTKLIDISVLKDSVSPDLSHSLLFIHALSGCDTTSRPYGIGKTSAMGKYADLQEASKLFMLANSKHEDIEKAGNQALAILYGSVHGWDLNFERASKFTEKVVSSSCYMPPERLPPTSDAAKFHSYRVYLQVQMWLGNNLEPTKWGWDLHKTKQGCVLKPHRMDQDAAPASLLKIIRCNCTGKCDKNTCSCKQNGLQCTLACSNCKGTTRMNWQGYDSCDNDD